MEVNKNELYVQKYLEDCSLRRRLSCKTIKAYRLDLKQYLDFIGNDLEENNKIIKYIYFLNEKYIKYKTIKRKIATIKAFYTYLEYEEIILVSPFKKIRTKIKEPEILPKTLSINDLDEIFRILYQDIKDSKSAFRRIQSYRNAAIVELLFSTGIRVSELCNIKIDDIDLNAKTLKIIGKGSKERILYIGNENVLNVLKQYKILCQDRIMESGYFFINKCNKKLSEQAVRNFLIRIENQITGNVHITPHMFRHTFATLLLEKDVDIRYIQKILGHSSITITQIYTHVAYPKQKEIMTIKNPRNDLNISNNT